MCDYGKKTLNKFQTWAKNRPSLNLYPNGFLLIIDIA